MADDKTPEAKAPGDEKALPVVDDAEIETDAEDTADETEAEATEDAAEGDEEAPDGDEAEGDGEEAKPLTKSARERAKQKAKIAAAEEVARRAVAERDAAQAALARLSDDLGPPPKAEDFADHDEFVAELAAYKAEARAITRQKKAAQDALASTQESAGKSAIDVFKERAMALRDSHPGIETKIFSQSSLPIPDVLAGILMEAETGPEIAFYLANNPAEMQRIFSMSPGSAARAFGRIEEKLAAAPKPRTQTKAPPPAPTVNKGSTRIAKNPRDMNPEEYRKWRANGGGD